MSTLNSVSAVVSIQTEGHVSSLADITSVPVGQGLLIIASGNTLTVYSISSTDPAIASMVKTQVAQKVVS